MDVPKENEYSRIERRFCALRKVRLWTNRSVIQRLCGVPTATRRKIRRFYVDVYVDVYVDESSKIESRLCALRTVKLWTKETAGCNRLPMVLLVPIGNAGSMVVPKLQIG